MTEPTFEKEHVRSINERIRRMAREKVFGRMPLRHHRAGNDRPWQTRPSDHLAGNRLHVHGPIQPMQEPGFLARLLGRR
jgi:hypothetical protein